MTDRFLEIVRDSRTSAAAEEIPLEAPAFTVPARAAVAMGWAVCAGCDRGIAPGEEIRWRDVEWHALCVRVELLALRSAA
jgi:hypothetical protein